MANQYIELKKKHEKEFNEFPISFAFSNEQFAEGMQQLGLFEEDKDKVVSIGSGGFIRKSDVASFKKLISRHETEMQEAINNDSTGEGFIFDMFNHELSNHEYGYTRDIESTLDALGFTINEINANQQLSHGLKTACDMY